MNDSYLTRLIRDAFCIDFTEKDRPYRRKDPLKRCNLTFDKESTKRIDEIARGLGVDPVCLIRDSIEFFIRFYEADPSFYKHLCEEARRRFAHSLLSYED